MVTLSGKGTISIKCQTTLYKTLYFHTCFQTKAQRKAHRLKKKNVGRAGARCYDWRQESPTSYWLLPGTAHLQEPEPTWNGFPVPSREVSSKQKQERPLRCLLQVEEFQACGATVTEKVELRVSATSTCHGGFFEFDFSPLPNSWFPDPAHVSSGTSAH